MDALDDPSITPSIETYNVVLKGLMTGKSEANIDEAIRIYDSLPSMGYVRDAGTFEALIEGMVSHNRIDDALEIFYQIHIDAEVMETSKKKLQNAPAAAARGRVDKLEKNSNKVSPSTRVAGLETQFANMMDSFDEDAKAADFAASKEGRAQARAEKKEQERLEQEELGDTAQMRKRQQLLTTRSYNLIINALSKHADTIDGADWMKPEAWKLFTQMGEGHCERDTETYNFMLVSLISADNITRAVLLFDTMPDVGQHFDGIPSKNQATYDLMLDGYARNEMFDELRVLLDQMTVEKGLKKNTWPFLKEVQLSKPFYHQKMTNAW